MDKETKKLINEIKKEEPKDGTFTNKKEEK